MSRHRRARAESALAIRLEGLNRARELGEGRLDDDVLQHAYDVLARAATRRSLSAEHTVVGFFGATGSGKSSLFNAVTGSTAARVAYRRPTTSEPLAMVWEPEGSEPLLDWLEVGERRTGTPVPGLTDDGGGLVLLDLPDFDSVQEAHRATVERLAGQVDVLVWVVDPQKYADAALHSDFIQPFSAHGAVTLVVLNQVDRLDPNQVPPVVESLAGILRRDGLGNVPVLPVSAESGAGIAALRKAIGAVAAARAAQAARLGADLTVAAARLSAASGEGTAAGVHSSDRRDLAVALAKAAHVDTVVDAVRVSYRLEATKRTGWPVTRWISRFRRDPLRRLSLRRPDAPGVNRTSLPAPGAAEQAQIDSALRAFGNAAGTGAPVPWRAAIRAAARSRREDLPDAVDQAVAGADLSAGIRSWWWPVFSILQWIALLTAVVGLGWLAGLALLGYFQLPTPEVPRIEGWPVPTLLVAAGVVAGIFLAVTGKVSAAAGARRRAAAARRRLEQGITATAEDLVVAPVEDEVARFQQFQQALAAAS